MTPIVAFNSIVGFLFTWCFLYQVVFFFIGLLRGQVKIPAAKKQHRYAFFIAAHNEEAVIANLVKSIKDQGLSFRTDRHLRGGGRVHRQHRPSGA